MQSAGRVFASYHSDRYAGLRTQVGGGGGGGACYTMGAYSALNGSRMAY